MVAFMLDRIADFGRRLIDVRQFSNTCWDEEERKFVPGWCEEARQPLRLIFERRRLIGNRGRQALNPRCSCDPDSGDNDLTGDPDQPD